MGILKNTEYRVYADGGMVTMEFGNVPITVDYNTALQLAQFLRIAGRKAKANAGDTSRNIRSFGLLTDAESDEQEAQKAKDTTAIFKVI